MNSVDFSSMLSGLGAIAQALIGLAPILGVMAASFLILQGARQMWRPDTSYRGVEVNVAKVFANFLAAAFLIQLSSTISMGTELTAGAGSEVRAAMTDSVAASSTIWQQFIAVMFLWLGMIGVYAVFRSGLLLRDAISGESQGGGKDPLWGAIWHFLGGCILINMGIGS